MEDAVVAMAIDQPAWGQLRVSNELAKVDVSISQAGFVPFVSSWL